MDHLKFPTLLNLLVDAKSKIPILPLYQFEAGELAYSLCPDKSGAFAKVYQTSIDIQRNLSGSFQAAASCIVFHQRNRHTHETKYVKTMFIGSKFFNGMI
jgi:hypothetical protein